MKAERYISLYEEKAAASDAINPSDIGDGEVPGAVEDTTLLPAGIVRVTDEGIAAERLLPCAPATDADPIIVAAFDFDGTCLSGSSPKRLVTKLGLNRMIGPYKLLRTMLWGAGYKLNLPTDPEGVRRRVFSAFRGLPAKAVNRFLGLFYKSDVAPMWRKDADAAMFAHLEAGHAVVLVSASFEPIVAAAMLEHPIQFALASRMQINAEGEYTGEVEGLPTEGPGKIATFRAFADEYFGEGKWRLGFSYADHYSDLTMLEAAEHPCAVTPDRKLARVAEERGWDILDWS